MIAALLHWLHPHRAEQREITARRNDLVREIEASSRKAASQAFDLIEETEAARKKGMAESVAIGDLLAHMDKRRHDRQNSR